MKKQSDYHFSLRTIFGAGAVGMGLLVWPAALSGAVLWAMGCGCGAVFLTFCAMVQGEEYRAARRAEKEERRIEP